jgi:hypothetical protein
MRANELECVHGVGHSGDVHGCDGCCVIIAKAVEGRIIKLLEGLIEERSGVNLQGAIALIKEEQNPHARAETIPLSTEINVNTANSACSCGCKGDNK